MKKIVMITVLFSLALFANESLFTGNWCVEEQELVITFDKENTVTYSSESEDGMSGEGSFEVVKDTLIANIANEEMEITIKYIYKEDGDTVKVQTAYIAINGDEIEHSDEWIVLQRCEK